MCAKVTISLAVIVGESHPLLSKPSSWSALVTFNSETASIHIANAYCKLG